MKHPFEGLHGEGMEFLMNLSFNNDVYYFNEHRSIYEEHVKAPMVRLCEALEPTVLSIDPQLDTRANRTICRIRKDARYHKGDPYRTNMWLSYKPADRGNSDYFTYFFYYEADCYGAGIGFHGIQKPKMDAFRARIDREMETFQRIINRPEMKTYYLSGEDYKRPKRDDLPEDVALWYNKKRISVFREFLMNDRAFSPQLADDVIQVFMDLIPLYDFVMGRDVRFSI